MGRDLEPCMLEFQGEEFGSRVPRCPSGVEMFVPATPAFSKFFCGHIVVVCYYTTNVARAAGTAFCAAFFDIVDFDAETFPVARSLISVYPCPSVVDKLCLSAVNSVVGQLSVA
jgi:hypothetical protein